ncbi:MAG: hypothetical protein A2152_00545 [Candidatus Levybacteria bacterium RBG_16_35_6]|nr:MAG: hypothetical protein A2152_00545 [Candidatus Levybacteria bacterium RBG_16_35_6]
MVIFPFVPLIPVLIITQSINAVLLLPVLIFLYILSNDKKILGGYINSKITNTIVILAFTGISIAVIIYLFATFFPNLFG